jgi:thiol-disulfide isomerase/thioredoxin
MIKRTGLLAIALLLFLNAKAQFTLSGKILNYKNNESLKINIPLVFGFYEENSIDIPVDKAGNFNIVLPLKEQKFVRFIFRKKESYTYLITPKRSLTLRCNGADSSVVPISGTAFKENKLLADINLREFPFSIEQADQYRSTLLTITAIQEKVIKPWLAIRDKKIGQVNATDISSNDKALINSEIKYTSIIYLNDFARTGIANRTLIDEFISYLYDPLTIKPDVFPAGPEYYYFARSYGFYLETKAITAMKKKGLKNNEPLDFYKISVDSATTLERNYGKPYLRWILSINNFPLNVVENLIYQEMINSYRDKDLKQLEPLIKSYTAVFPKSRHLVDIRSKLVDLKARLKANEQNTAIKVVENYKDTKSIYEVVSKLKGKVVYLDIWGTWCGPCKYELKYGPQLKAHFKGKDVVFIYLDMDEEDKDATWKEFIKVNGLEGLHLRKDRAAIQPFWDELISKKEDQKGYPSYFIFDKNGKLVVADALRPSDEAALYKQIEGFL